MDNQDSDNVKCMTMDHTFDSKINLLMMGLQMVPEICWVYATEYFVLGIRATVLTHTLLQYLLGLGVRNFDLSKLIMYQGSVFPTLGSLGTGAGCSHVLVLGDGYDGGGEGRLHREREARLTRAGWRSSPEEAQLWCFPTISLML